MARGRHGNRHVLRNHRHSSVVRQHATGPAPGSAVGALIRERAWNPATSSSSAAVTHSLWSARQKCPPLKVRIRNSALVCSARSRAPAPGTWASESPVQTPDGPVPDSGGTQGVGELLRDLVVGSLVLPHWATPACSARSTSPVWTPPPRASGSHPSTPVHSSPAPTRQGRRCVRQGRLHEEERQARRPRRQAAVLHHSGGVRVGGRDPARQGDRPGAQGSRHRRAGEADRLRPDRRQAQERRLRRGGGRRRLLRHPVQLLQGHALSGNAGLWTNYGHYKSKQTDDLLAQMANAADEATVKKYSAKLEKLTVAERHRHGAGDAPAQRRAPLRHHRHR